MNGIGNRSSDLPPSYQARVGLVDEGVVVKTKRRGGCPPKKVSGSGFRLRRNYSKMVFSSEISPPEGRNG